MAASCFVFTSHLEISLEHQVNEGIESNEGSERRLANLRPFPKGVSGNPGGKSKKLEELKRLALDHSARAIQRIAELIESDDERVAIMAAKEILDRALGRPKPTEDADEASAKALTINIIRYSDGNQPPAQVDATTVSVRSVALS